MSSVDEGHPPDESGCKLLDSFAIFVQIVLAGLAFSTLIIKHQRESPQRPLSIWSFDVSKQLIGGGVIHTLNIVASHLFGKSLDGEPESNPCVWYFLNILVDTTLGVLIIWAVLAAVKFIARFYRLKGLQSGVYGEPPLVNQIIVWTKQLGVYILALITMKVVVLILFGLCPWLETFGEWVLGWTMGNYRLQVLFVMLVFPLVMNIVQFWIVDTIVKHKASRSIRLTLDEELPDDMLISDGEYNADASSLHDNGSEDDDTASISPVKVHHKSATKANLHHTFSNQNSVSEESLYELRTNTNNF
ncbi:vacuolar membrane protein-domain-containing protein [Parasitella parasitica]|nr:vacuolar membrane protein-domain-containing protein [Parasitella parasitica]